MALESDWWTPDVVDKESEVAVEMTLVLNLMMETDDDLNLGPVLEMEADEPNLKPNLVLKVETEQLNMKPVLDLKDKTEELNLKPDLDLKDETEELNLKRDLDLKDETDELNLAEPAVALVLWLDLSLGTILALDLEFGAKRKGAPDEG